MRLLFAIKSLNVQGGGAERVLVDVVNGLAERGHNVQVLTFDAPGEGFYVLDQRVQRLDTGIGQPGQPTPRSGFVRAIPRIRRIVREARAEMVVAFMHSTYVPLAIALLGSGTRLVVSEHVDAAHFRTRPMQRLLVKAVERMAIAKTVPSAPLRDEHPDAVRHRVHVLPNPVDLDVFAATSATPPAQPRVITSIGRLMEEKGHVDLIRAFAKLEGDYPDWSLRIVGDGELRPQLEAEISQLGLSGRVHLAGVTYDVAAEYAAATIVALPSFYESFGLVAAEALASSRPVLAFADCLGIADMIESGRNGMLLRSDPDRVTSLADGLKQLMSDSQLRERLAAAGPDSVRRYALNDVVNTWEEFLLSFGEREC